MTPRVLELPPSTPPERLAGALDAQLALERAEETRSGRVHLTALLSLPVAVAGLWPALFSEVGRRAAFTCWGLSAAGALGALLHEWRLRRRT